MATRLIGYIDEATTLALREITPESKEAAKLFLEASFRVGFINKDTKRRARRIIPADTKVMFYRPAPGWSQRRRYMAVVFYLAPGKTLSILSNGGVKETVPPREGLEHLPDTERTWVDGLLSGIS